MRHYWFPCRPSTRAHSFTRCSIIALSNNRATVALAGAISKFKLCWLRRPAMNEPKQSECRLSSWMSHSRWHLETRHRRWESCTGSEHGTESSCRTAQPTRTGSRWLLVTSEKWAPICYRRACPFPINGASGWNHSNIDCTLNSLRHWCSARHEQSDDCNENIPRWRTTKQQRRQQQQQEKTLRLSPPPIVAHSTCCFLPWFHSFAFLRLDPSRPDPSRFGSNGYGSTDQGKSEPVKTTATATKNATHKQSWCISR